MAEDKSRIFSFSLVSKNTAKVNALVFGVGLDMTFSDKTYPLKVNVINIEANPIAPLVFLYGANRLKFPQNPNIVFKGLDITTGRCGVNSVVDVTGISFSGFSYGYSNTGIAITGLYNYSTVLKGVYISGLSNTSQSGSGLFIAAFNTSENLYGIEIGGYNDSVDMHGIQIGLVNMTNRQKGIQLGIWNINGKKSMPFINW